MEIPIKTPAEIETMRKCGKILGNLLKKLKENAKPGTTTLDLDTLALQICEEENVKPAFLGYKGYPAVICSSVNDEVVHSIPTKRELKPGDLLSIDCGVVLDGMITDAAVSLIVEGEKKPEIENLLNTAKKALSAGIKQIRPGNKTGDIGFAIQEVVHKAGYHIIRELTGHGVGRRLHEPPIINNYGKRGEGFTLKPGMTLAIEPIIAVGTRFIKTLGDNWTIVTKDSSLAIQIEHTILVTPSGNEILTLSS
ncbi:MAG: type I methionyl aminopeptidase [Candidatus Gracilibacteria bacterium]|jgi:methionyl aminopeptidase